MGLWIKRVIMTGVLLIGFQSVWAEDWTQQFSRCTAEFDLYQRVLTHDADTSAIPDQKEWIEKCTSLGVSLLEKGSQPDYYQKGELLHVIGWGYIYQNMDREALPYLEKMTESYSKTRWYLNALVKLGQVYYRLGDYKMSLTIHDRLVQLLKQAQYQNHPDRREIEYQTKYLLESSLSSKPEPDLEVLMNSEDPSIRIKQINAYMGMYVDNPQKQLAFIQKCRAKERYVEVRNRLDEYEKIVQLRLGGKTADLYAQELFDQTWRKQSPGADGLLRRIIWTEKDSSSLFKRVLRELDNPIYEDQSYRLFLYLTAVPIQSENDYRNVVLPVSINELRGFQESSVTSVHTGYYQTIWKQLYLNLSRQTSMDKIYFQSLLLLKSAQVLRLPDADIHELEKQFLIIRDNVNNLKDGNWIQRKEFLGFLDARIKELIENNVVESADSGFMPDEDFNSLLIRCSQGDKESIFRLSGLCSKLEGVRKTSAAAVLESQGLYFIPNSSLPQTSRWSRISPLNTEYEKIKEKMSPTYMTHERYLELFHIN